MAFSRLQASRSQLIRQTIAPITTRTLTTSSRLAQGPAPGNTPPSQKSANQHDRHLADDPQSSASSKDPDEHKTGDDHPAKQPDTQEPAQRSTGFQEKGIEGGVSGGKEGLSERSDREGGSGGKSVSG